ncbi:MAG: TIGR04372 family glycosyltransferase [Ilumatobacteraceae bacterium]|nr:TIGR04372 family glycosyltransferase [Ilumatobacteraceae bacterium]
MRRLKKLTLQDLLLVVPALVTAILLRVLRLIVTIRFRNLPADEIGPLTVVSQHYLRIKETQQKKRQLDFWYLKDSVKVSNDYMLSFVKSQIKVRRSRFIELVAAISEKLPGAQHHQIESEIRITLLEGVGKKLKLPQKDRDSSSEYVKKIGIDPQKEFIALMVRDGAYKSDIVQANTQVRTDKEIYRNQDVNDYLQVAEKFASMNVQIVRMGAKVERPFTSNSPLIIDYASTGMRTEAADIYLASECAMCISTNLGFDHIAAMSGKLRVITNQALIIQASTLFYSTDVFILQRFIERSSGRLLTLSESLQFAEIRNLDWYHKVIDRGLDFVRNTPEEILEASLEGWQRSKGQWVDSPEGLELQAKYWHIYDTFFPEHKDRFLNGRPHVGASFLRNNKSWLA